ncbi:type II toxin-antitoxin system PrlF family antitoxin [Paenibacillus abyssi]|uniref:SpoVT-AbrB domain-containing protein n=1 Tax=Paenibacillus abyssi TaxID=1340531 RepID=A0A917G265_9BACL|nr:type II toxin-antitoxin system PrlF family antitoxin [Paenibacillus abyssi]GGG18084.1 hypothetical protein GCM10010916_38610 [Paenibacillus abyssi]
MFYSKITSKGQTTVPMEIRKRLGLEEGSYIKYSIGDAGEVVMEKDALMTLTDKGLRIFYADENGSYYEIFQDKTRRQVEREWVLSQLENNRKNDFKGMLIHEQQIEYLRAAMNQEHSLFLVNNESVKFYHTLGLLNDEEFVFYHERKRIRDQR